MPNRLREIDFLIILEAELETIDTQQNDFLVNF